MGWFSDWTWSDIGHTVLDVAGVVPVIGEAADAVNAAWLAGEGKYDEALFSVISMIPAVGDVVGKGGKLALRAIKKGGPEAAKVARELLGKLDGIGIDKIKDFLDKWLPQGIADKLKQQLDDLIARLKKIVGEEGAEKSGNTGSVGSDGVNVTEDAHAKNTGAGHFQGSADEAYDAIRASTTDVESIARNTGIKPENIQKVKDHVFNNEHLLDRYAELGVPAELGRFDSDIGIANAWKRLEHGTHTMEDIDLLKHETAEAWYMSRNGPGYSAAHEAAENRFPAPKLGGE